MPSLSDLTMATGSLLVALGLVSLFGSQLSLLRARQHLKRPLAFWQIALNRWSDEIYTAAGQRLTDRTFVLLLVGIIALCVGLALLV